MKELADEQELHILFSEEMNRYIALVESNPGDSVARLRAWHSMRGAASMMGHTDLAAFLNEVEVRERNGEITHPSQTLDELGQRLMVLKVAVQRPNESLYRPSLPTPTPKRLSDPMRESVPDGLARSSDRPSIDPEVWSFFVAESRQRIEQLTDVFTRLSTAPTHELLNEAFRHVHAIKGAAALVGLPAVANAAHAMESAFAKLRTEQRSPTLPEMDALSYALGQIELALTAPEDSVRPVELVASTLRSFGLIGSQEDERSRLPSQGRMRKQQGEREEFVRVPVKTLANLAGHVSEFALAPDRLIRSANALREASRRLGGIARLLEESLRRIGPPRPWGVPADVIERLLDASHSAATLVSEIDTEAGTVGRDSERIASVAGEARESLRGLGASPAVWLFNRVVPAVDLLSRQQGKDVRVVRVGEDVEIPRGLSERLVEPLLQVVRNAVTHGVEQPSIRLSRGKPARATIRLEAKIQSERLMLVVEDDGAGIDIERVGWRACALGLLTEREVRDERAVLATLFSPGLSTQSHADHSAGRGVGLDLVRREVSQLGGTVSVASSKGVLSRFTIEIGVRSLSLRVVVVVAEQYRIALAVDRIERVVTPADLDHGVRVVNLRTLLGCESAETTMQDKQENPVLVVSCGVGDHRNVAIVVDHIDQVREIVAKPLPVLMSSCRLYRAVALDSEGRITFVVDIDELCKQALAVGT